MNHISHDAAGCDELTWEELLHFFLLHIFIYHIYLFIWFSGAGMASGGSCKGWYWLYWRIWCVTI